MTALMPMCDECHRPLGLFYAECLVCFGNADLHGTYYDQWCEWQAGTRPPPAPLRPHGAPCAGSQNREIDEPKEGER